VPPAALLEAGLVRPSRRGGSPYETFYGRIVMPDRDFSFRVTHMVGRVFPPVGRPGRGPKYLALPGWPKPLYGLASLSWKSKEPVYIVEGPLDRLTLLQWGCAAVALAGAGLKPDHGQSLLALGRPLTLVPDSDEAGQLAGERWRAALAGAEGLALLRLPERIGKRSIKDVNDLAGHPRGRAIFRDLVRRTQNASPKETKP
jgi:DNA primase